MPLFELPLENKKHPNFEWRGQGRGVDSYASEVTLFEYNVSTILSPIVASPVQEDPSADCRVFPLIKLNKVGTWWSSSMSFTKKKRFYSFHIGFPVLFCVIKTLYLPNSGHNFLTFTLSPLSSLWFERTPFGIAHKCECSKCIGRWPKTPQKQSWKRVRRERVGGDEEVLLPSLPNRHSL